MKNSTVLVAIGLVAFVSLTMKAKAKTLVAAVEENFKLFGSIVEEMALRYGVPARRIQAMILVESMNDPRAVGSAGERGLMQLKEGALSDVNRFYALDYSFSDLFNVKVNIEVGSAYLALCYKYTGRSSWNKATQAYNAGPGTLQKNPSAGSDYLAKVLQKENAILEYLKT